MWMANWVLKIFYIEIFLINEQQLVFKYFVLFWDKMAMCVGFNELSSKFFFLVLMYFF